MINEIGEDSGKIWQYLSQRPQAVLRDINKTLRQGDNMLFVTIGMPPRKGKGVFSREGKGVNISLTTQ